VAGRGALTAALRRSLRGAILPRVPARGDRSVRRTRRALAAGTSAAALLATGAVALAAPPIPGARYAGRSDQRAKVELRVGAGGARLTAYRFGGAFRCNALPGRFDWRVGPIAGVRQLPVRVAHDGSFAVAVHVDAALPAPGGVTRRVHAAYTLKGRFDPRSGDAVPGTVHGRLRALVTGARGLRCDSGVRGWSARSVS
jgi:hypothetical protein